MSRRRRRQEQKKQRETQIEAYWCGVCYEEHKQKEIKGVTCRKCRRVSHCEETYVKWQNCCVCRTAFCGGFQFRHKIKFGEGGLAERVRPWLGQREIDNIDIFCICCLAWIVFWLSICIYKLYGDFNRTTTVSTASPACQAEEYWTGSTTTGMWVLKEE